MSRFLTSELIKDKGQVALLPSIVKANVVDSHGSAITRNVAPPNLANLVEGAPPSQNISSNLLKYSLIGLVVGSATPLIASYMTGTHAEMKPIADKAYAIVSFTGVGATLGAIAGVLVDAIESAINSYLTTRSQSEQPSGESSNKIVI